MMKTVTVFMSTYNGSKFVKEQIDSILGQEGVIVKIIVRDDGSKDSTVNILKEYENKIQVIYGSNIGYGKSFLSIFDKVVEPTDYYAYADQDDIWYSNKLKSAICCLENIESNNGKIYFSNLEVVDENKVKIGYKSFDNLKISMGSVLVRQRIAGCTMVFDNALFDKARIADFSTYNFHISHEWIYILCLAVGGTAYYDKNAYIQYRRHKNAATSFKNGIISRVKNEIKSFGIARNDKYELAKKMLLLYKKDITGENLELLETIASYKENVNSKIKLLKRKDLDSGNWLYNLKNRVCIIFGVY